MAGIADRESMDDRPIVDRPIDERKSLVVAAAAAAISISSTALVAAAGVKWDDPRQINQCRQSAD